MVDDIELLRRYAEENAEPAFAELVQRHLDLVYSAALRRLAGDAHSAADVTQQVFTALARQAGTLARGVVLPAWLYNTTRNTAVDFIRVEQRRRAREQEAHAMQQLDSDFSAADWERLRPLLDAAMDDLNHGDREAVVLRYFARRPFAEVGRTLHVSEDAARMRVERALEKLRMLLARRGVASTAAALSLVLAQQSVLAAPVGMAGAVTGAALASSAGVVTPTVGLVQFMSTSKLAATAVGLVLVATLGTIGYEIHGQRATRSAVVQARQEKEAAQARMRELRQRQAAVQQALGRKQGELADKRAMQAAERAQAAGAAAAREVADLAAGNAFMERYPEVKAVYMEERRATAAGWYAPLFKRRQLSPEQIARCTELMVGETGTVSIPGGKSFRFSAGASEAETRQELQALLGEDGYEEYRQSQRSGGWSAALQQVINLATDLFDGPTPLRAGQAEALRQILLEETKPTGSLRTTFNWPGISHRAQELLSEPQLAMLERYRANDELRQALDRARAELTKAGSR